MSEQSKAQIILPIQEYEELLRHKTQNLETKKTWENHFNKRFEILEKEFNEKTLTLEDEHNKEIKKIIKQLIEDKTHALILISTIKNEDNIFNFKPVLKKYVYSLTPILEVKKIVSKWRWMFD